MSRGNDKLSYGIILLIFGFLFLLDKLGILIQIPYASKLLSIGAFFLISGIVFLITQPKKGIGWIFTIIGVVLNANLFFGWMQSYSRYLVPIALIAGGIILVISSRKR